MANHTAKKIRFYFDQFNADIFNNELRYPDMFKVLNTFEVVGIAKLQKLPVFYGVYGTFSDGENGSFDMLAVMDDQPEGELLDTIAHEMVHLWQFENDKPLNHGKEFKAMMQKIYIFYGGLK